MATAGDSVLNVNFEYLNLYVSSRLGEGKSTSTKKGDLSKDMELL